MAKKAVASFKKADGRTYSKVIKMVKSPKTGAYTFQEEMVPNEAVKYYFSYGRDGPPFARPRSVVPYWRASHPTREAAPR